MDQQDFRVIIRRLPGGLPLVTLRFEMKEGYGELIVGGDRKASPSAAGEIAEATGEQLRAGRFVHVLASGQRRQSYSLSRIDDNRIQRLSDNKWTELQSFTEFGLRYLDLPDLSASRPAVAAVQVSANPAPSRAQVPPTTRSDTAHARSVTPPKPSPRTPQIRASSGNPAPARSTAPASQPPSNPARSVQPGLAAETVKRLSVEQLRAQLLREMQTVHELDSLVERLESDLTASQARERDLLDLLSRWQKRG